MKFQKFQALREFQFHRCHCPDNVSEQHDGRVADWVKVCVEEKSRLPDLHVGNLLVRAFQQAWGNIFDQSTLN